MYRIFPIVAALALGTVVAAPDTSATETDLPGAVTTPAPLYAPPGPYHQSGQSGPRPGANRPPYYYGRPIPGQYGAPPPAPMPPGATPKTVSAAQPDAAASESVVEAESGDAAAQPGDESHVPLAEVTGESGTESSAAAAPQMQTEAMSPETPAIAESAEATPIESAEGTEAVETVRTMSPGEKTVSSTETGSVSAVEKTESGNVLESTKAKVKAFFKGEQDEPEVDTATSVQAVETVSVETAAEVGAAAAGSTQGGTSQLSPPAAETAVSVATVEAAGALPAEQQLLRLKVLQDLADEGIISADEELSIRRRVLNAQ